ncbi:hypothetical protein BDZ97DRAFT_2076399 [Flammula alnicola]|nr:hypothetical protein BDZ97DRAFT_2076399 [Flammula alnicola]
MSSDSRNQSATTILCTAQLSNDLWPHVLHINGRRILSIELEPRPSELQGIFVYPSQEDTGLSPEQKIIEKIKQIVAEDIQAIPSERIDSVVIGSTSGTSPTEEMCQALGGLSPNHLTISSDRLEEANFANLKVLQHQWTDLQTLHLMYLCQYIEDSNELPTIFSQISSLTLSFCCSFNFIPPGGTTRLKHLRTQENGAFDMFMTAFDENPALAETLEVLDVESTNGCDFTQFGFEELQDRLERCTNLRELRLVVGHHHGLDAILASYIPSSVEKLSVKCSRSLPFLHNFDNWIDHAKDASWLPRLESFQMSIDAKGEIAESQKYYDFAPSVSKTPLPKLSVEEFDLAFEAKRKALYDMLRSTRPNMELIS